ncbi:hypothetical protein M8C21_014519 [Ambrosia artemisiifolia]|uniref:Uncharacterized protein n=1 Tax=Ambrosia artemisiifolia TaxID=4212 RepID=A0AAD5CBG0_AMBAR|nr:hypothetical protein M8C21_014519 [Ambrosia artemisiifolia]
MPTLTVRHKFGHQDSIFIFVTEPTMAMETPWADEKKSMVVGSATSYDDSDPWTISDHSAAVSIINTKLKNVSADEINQARGLQSLTNHDYMEKIMEVNDKLDMVKDMVRPGCSYEVLNTALRYMSSLATTLSTTPQNVRASL